MDYTRRYTELYKLRSKQKGDILKVGQMSKAGPVFALLGWEIFYKGKLMKGVLTAPIDGGRIAGYTHNEFLKVKAIHG